MKKLALALVVLALLVFVFAGCGGQSSGSSSGAAAESKTPITISYYFPLHVSNTAEQFSDDAPGLARLREKTGVTIKWELVPGGNASLQTESFNLMMASGNIPDVVCGDIPSRLKLYPQAWATLDNLIPTNPSRYPNLKKYIFDDPYLKVWEPEDDGHWRYIPMLSTRRIGSTLMVRQDLLSKYGMQVPVTMDDWYKLLTMAKQDGKVPYMTRQQRNGILVALLQGYADCVKEDYFEENGVIKYGVMDPRFRETVELARKWYAEGLIDPEYPTTASTRWQEDVLRGDVFATSDNIQRLPWANLDYLNRNIAYRMVAVAPMQSPRTGQRHTTDHYPHVRDKSIAISRSARNIDRILDMFEYCYSDEGFVLMNFGIEGYSFSYVNGTPQLYPDYTTKVTNGELKHVVTIVDMPKVQKDELYFDYNTDREDHVSLRTARDMYANGNYIIENWVQSIGFTDAERAALNPLKADLDTYRSEMLDKFIMGIEPMSNWNNFVTQIQRMNLQRTIDIYQAALNRLLKK